MVKLWSSLFMVNWNENVVEKKVSFEQNLKLYFLL